MLKKFFAVTFIVAILIFCGNNFTNAAVEKIYSELNFQQVTTGSEWYGRVVNCREWISLRKSPSTQATRLAKIPLGAIVKVQSSAADGYPADWYRVYYNGAWGWCLKEYIRYDEHIRDIW